MKEGRIEAATYTILQAIEDEDDSRKPLREGLKETPLRVARMYKELCGGYLQDPTAMLSRTFESEVEYDGIIAEMHIPFFSLCEHHMMPFVGEAHIGYIPRNNRVLGLSKLARLLDVFARRLQIQERLTEQVCEALWTAKPLAPKGVIVIVEAEHFCMSMRGIQKRGVKTVTSSIRGLFYENPAAKSEFLALLGK